MPPQTRRGTNTKRLFEEAISIFNEGRPWDLRTRALLEMSNKRRCLYADGSTREMLAGCVDMIEPRTLQRCRSRFSETCSDQPYRIPTINYPWSPMEWQCATLKSFDDRGLVLNDSSTDANNILGLMEGLIVKHNAGGLSYQFGTLSLQITPLVFDQVLDKLMTPVASGHWYQELRMDISCCKLQQLDLSKKVVEVLYENRCKLTGVLVEGVHDMDILVPCMTILWGVMIRYVEGDAELEPLVGCPPNHLCRTCA